MVTLVLVLGLVNLLLGFLAAAALAEPPPWQRWRIVFPSWQAGAGTVLRTEHSAEVASSSLAASISPCPTSMEAPPPEAAPLVLEDLPKQWLELLTAEGIQPGSFVEASAHVVRLEVNRYREQLAIAESRARAQLAARDETGLKLLCDDVQAINQDWLERQTEAAESLGQRAGQNGRHEDAARALEQALLDQAAAIGSTNDSLSEMDLKAVVESGGRQLLHQLAGLVDQVHALRDRLYDLLATLMHAEGRLDSIPSNLTLDRASGLPNRIGIELLFHQWWRDDPRRERLLSVAAVDIDRFARVNERLGTRAGDRTLVAFGRLLGDLVRKDRGFDRVARLGGQSFLMFYGDTGPRNALTAVERARQTVEATSWDDQAAEFELSISCGVVEVCPDDDLNHVLGRLGATLLHAKRAGRNRAAVDEGAGPTTVDPPQFAVKGRVVEIGEE